jgi:peptide chain release factor 2
MRAEMVNVVAAIEKSLGLLAKRLDYDTAPYRLEEFNAMIEDPSLWDDQDRAQKADAGSSDPRRCDRDL